MPLPASQGRRGPPSDGICARHRLLPWQRGGRSRGPMKLRLLDGELRGVDPGGRVLMSQFILTCSTLTFLVKRDLLTQFTTLFHNSFHQIRNHSPTILWEKGLTESIPQLSTPGSLTLYFSKHLVLIGKGGAPPKKEIYDY